MCSFHCFTLTTRMFRVAAALHYLQMAKYDILLLDAINVFVRISQMARVFGIQFSDVISRGSQFRVESMLLRVLKQLSYLPPSISVEQRNRMDSPLTIPLNLEPISGIYRDPVAVLDFQSLYPSACIAYNYCFSTCLGKISEMCNEAQQQNIKLGALNYCTLSAAELKHLIDTDSVHISPVGGVFVKPSVKVGALPRMLKELLDTRLMVKGSMKRYKDNKVKQNSILNVIDVFRNYIECLTLNKWHSSWLQTLHTDTLLQIGRVGLMW